MLQTPSLVQWKLWSWQTLPTTPSPLQKIIPLLWSQDLLQFFNGLCAPNCNSFNSKRTDSLFLKLTYIISQGVYLRCIAWLWGGWCGNILQDRVLQAFAWAQFFCMGYCKERYVSVPPNNGTHQAGLLWLKAIILISISLCKYQFI